MISMKHSQARAALCFAAASFVLVGTPAAAASQEELEARVQALAQQLQAVQAELAELKAAPAAAAGSASASTESATVSGLSEDTNAVANTNEQRRGLDWFGYGEINYQRPTKDNSSSTADVGRFVLGASYRFDERTRLVTELEIEHAVSSADDQGEVEVEQAWIERGLNDTTYAKLGLFLIPSGMLNENHEPTQYYGVFRNFVETAIIPSTWREIGVAVQGNTARGLRWDVGLTTGHDLSKWDTTSTEGVESPLGAIHQEGQLARAGDLSGFLALNYTGVPGLRLGTSVVGGEISQGQPGFDNNQLVLWDAHARWTPGNWDFSSVYAHGHISNTAAANRAFVGNPVLIPESFFGWYLQGAYVFKFANLTSIAPFLRFERVNTASSYAFIGQGLTPRPLDTEEVTTVGFNLNLGPGVVVKLDYQAFDVNSDANRVDLGLGYTF